MAFVRSNLILCVRLNCIYQWDIMAPTRIWYQLFNVVFLVSVFFFVFVVTNWIWMEVTHINDTRIVVAIKANGIHICRYFAVLDVSFSSFRCILFSLWSHKTSSYWYQHSVSFPSIVFFVSHFDSINSCKFSKTQNWRKFQCVANVSVWFTLPNT